MKAEIISEKGYVKGLKPLLGASENEVRLSCNIASSDKSIKISGKVLDESNIRGVIKQNSKIIGVVENVEINILDSTGKEYYEGEYIVKPQPHHQTVLNTANKITKENITVLKIPYYAVTNNFGNTVYIGSEVETFGN